jgi:hypothetical protein
MNATYELECLYMSLRAYAPVEVRPVIARIRHVMELDGVTEYEMAFTFADILVQGLRWWNWGGKNA